MDSAMSYLPTSMELVIISMETSPIYLVLLHGESEEPRSSITGSFSSQLRYRMTSLMVGLALGLWWEHRRPNPSTTSISLTRKAEFSSGSAASRTLPFWWHSITKSVRMKLLVSTGFLPQATSRSKIPYAYTSEQYLWCATWFHDHTTWLDQSPLTARSFLRLSGHCLTWHLCESPLAPIPHADTKALLQCL